MLNSHREACGRSERRHSTSSKTGGSRTRGFQLSTGIFNRSKRDLKSEISRNNNIAESDMRIGEISAEIRENELKKARLTGEQDELKTKKGAKHSQELQRITAEIRLATEQDGH